MLGHELGDRTPAVLSLHHLTQRRITWQCHVFRHQLLDRVNWAWGVWTMPEPVDHDQPLGKSLARV